MPKKIPKRIWECAQRLAAKNGVSAAEVIERFQASAKKAALTADDFFCPVSDISLGKVVCSSPADRLDKRTRRDEPVRATA